MSWTITMGDYTATVLDGAEVDAVMLGIGLAAQLDNDETSSLIGAVRKALAGYEEAARFDWRTPPLAFACTLPDGRTLGIVSDDPPVDPSRQCDGLNSDGERCGKSLNHRGPC